MKVALLLALLTVGEGDGSMKVKGHTGDDVTLPCSYNVNTNGLLYVCWSRGEIPLSGCKPLIVETHQAKVKEGTRMSNRYQLLGQLDTGDVSLTILNVTETDSGLYGCRVDIYGWFNDDKHHFDLTVDAASTTSTPVYTETSPGTPPTDALTPGQMTSVASSGVLTSSSYASSNVTGDDTAEVNTVTTALLCVFFGFVVLIAVGGVIIAITRKWRQLKVPRPLVHTSLSTLQLQSRGADQNIYQMDEDVYDTCP